MIDPKLEKQRRRLILKGLILPLAVIIAGLIFVLFMLIRVLS